MAGSKPAQQEIVLVSVQAVSMVITVRLEMIHANKALWGTFVTMEVIQWVTLAIVGVTVFWAIVVIIVKFQIHALLAIIVYLVRTAENQLE